MSDQSLQSKKYSKYTRQMRLKLIKYVDQDKLSTAHAARLLGIKQTSACRILRSYHKYNKIFEKKTDKLNRQKLQTQGRFQKKSHFQNIPFQQNKLASIRKIPENAIMVVQSPPSLSANQSYLQNTMLTSITFNSQGMTLLYHPIINYTNEYCPIYGQNVYPITYNYCQGSSACWQQ